MHVSTRARLVLFALSLLVSTTLATARERRTSPAETKSEPTEVRQAEGQAVYKKVEPKVFKVKNAPSAESPKASYGTGFVVDKAGLLITNYHVVSDAINTPRLHKLFVVIGEESVPARVLGVDVVHDLALIKVDRAFESWLVFAESAPRKGETIYSIGEPEDLNMAIVVGVYNDELRYGPYATIHMSSPINSGMSGGPTVNSRAEIIGVNVSKSVGSDSLSFAVPARFARKLIDRARDKSDVATDSVIEEMGTQLSDVQEELTIDFLKSAQGRKSFGNWNLIQPSDILKCWSEKDEDKKDGLYATISQNCSLPHSSYIDSSVHSGTYSFDLQAIDGRKLRASQFYTLMNSRFGTGGGSSVFPWMSFGGVRDLTTRACHSDMVTNRTGTVLKVAYCSRSYVKFRDLRDADIMISTLSPPPHGLILTGELRGFTTANAKKILRSIVDSIDLARPKADAK